MSPTTLRVHADRPRVDRAVGELYVALVSQNLAFGDRFERTMLPAAAQQRLRRLALSLCAFGAALCCYALLIVPVRCSSFAAMLLCLALFGMLAMAFHRLRQIGVWIQGRSRRLAGRALRKRADKTLAPMRAATPLEIEYRIDGGRIAGRWLGHARGWVRKLDAFAYVGESVCAIFSKRTAFNPRVVIVHGDRDRVASMLQARGVEVVALPLELPEEFARSAPAAPRSPSDDHG